MYGEERKKKKEALNNVTTPSTLCLWFHFRLCSISHYAEPQFPVCLKAKGPGLPTSGTHEPSSGRKEAEGVRLCSRHIARLAACDDNVPAVALV